jgi:hypothetical protein
LIFVILGLVGVASESLDWFSGLVSDIVIDAPGNNSVINLLSAQVEVPIQIALPLGAIVGSYCISRFCGKVREIFVVSSCLMLVGIGGLATVTQNSTSPALALGFFGGLGVGGIVGSAATVLTIICPQDLIGTAIGLGVSVISVGSSVGHIVVNYTIIVDLFSPAGTDNGTHEDIWPYKVMFLSSIAFSGTALVASVFMGRIRNHTVGQEMIS